MDTGLSQHSRRDMTDWLKGFAILSVMINHFLDVYVTRAFSGYANGIIALFFIISGHNLYYALEKYRRINWASVTHFFLRRCSRVYPLFWCSLIVISLYHEQLYPIWSFFLPSFRVLITYWFINALLQCYLIAPLFYIVLKRFGVVGYFACIMLVIIVVNVHPYFLSLTNELFFFRYKWWNMLYLVLFGVGMAFPLIMPQMARLFSVSRAHLIFSFGLFSLFVYFTRQRNMGFPGAERVFAPLLVLSALAFCFCVLSYLPAFPLIKPLVWLGTYSYSLYLFHLDYFFLLNRVGLTAKGTFMSLVPALICFPLFCLFCYGVETIVNKCMSPILVRTAVLADGKGA